MNKDLRTVNYPLDHVIAETIAFPIASEGSFRIASANIEEPQTLGGQRLWRAAEQHLISSYPSLPLEELVMLRDRTWYCDDNHFTSINLSVYMTSCAQQYLKVLGNTGRVQGLGLTHQMDSLNAHRSRARLAFRWLTFAIPADLLIAGTCSGSKPIQTVKLITNTMERMLRDKGFAETHLHLGAAIDFSSLWIAALTNVAKNSFRSEEFAAPGAAFDEGRELGAWLLRAALARYLLSAFLRRHECGESRGDWVNFASRELPAYLWTRLSINQVNTLNIAFRELRNGTLGQNSPQFAELRTLYRELTGVRPDQFPLNLLDFSSIDPIANDRPIIGDHFASPEYSFICAALTYLKGTGSGDCEFARLFWQEVRIRSIFYRHIVQRPLTPGLQWFTRFYGRLSPAKRPISVTAQVQGACNSCGLRLGLRSLELRTSPDEDSSAMRRFVETVASSFDTQCHIEKKNEHAEIGVVLHFTKDRGTRFKLGTPLPNWKETTADPSAGRVNPTGYRYASFFQTRRRQALSLARMLLSFPHLLKVVRGLDFCSDELAVPLWVLLPLIRYVSEASTVASEWLRANGEDVPPLRRTFHSGEDFNHIIGGLRSVSELVRYLDLDDGDRIGHGVVLGIDATNWARSVGKVVLTYEQRLLDLAWEWKAYTHHGVDFKPVRLAYISEQIHQLSMHIFQIQVSPSSLVEFVDSLHDENELRRTGFPDGLQLMPSNSILTHRYLTEKGIFERGHKNIWVDTASEAEALETLQEWVRHAIAQRGIVIEINPTSNLLIGNLGDLSNHPLWRLRPPIENHAIKSKIKVCIGSDDPITFATTLPDEYMLLYDTLILAGVDSDQAEAWIDQARNTGINHRFTLRDWRLPEQLPAIGMLNSDHIAPILHGCPLWK